VGIIAFVMTVTPYKPPLTGTPVSREGISSVPSLIQLAQLSTAQPLERGLVTFRIQNQQVTRGEARSLEIKLNIFNKAQDQEYAQSGYVLPNSTREFTFEIPKGGREGSLFTLDVNGQRVAMDQILITDQRTEIFILIEDGKVVTRGPGELEVKIEALGKSIENLSKPSKALDNIFKKFRF
jgi:hypothetical protein